MHLPVKPILRAGALALALAAWSSRGCSPSSPDSAAKPDQQAGLPAGPVSASADPDDPLLATVNGTPITKTDVDFWLLGGHGQKVTPELRQQALEQRIEIELMYQRGLELGLDKDKKYRAMIQGQAIKLEAAKRKEMARRVANLEIAAKLEITDQDTRAYFDQHKDTLTSEFHLAALTFPGPQAAEAALKDLQAGKPFESLAPKTSAAAPKGSKPGWDLGFLKYNQMPAEWTEAVSGLQPGQLSGIVHGQRTGIRILKLIERRPDPNATFDSLKGVIMNRLRDKLAQQKSQEYIQQLKAKATIVRAPGS
jgi:parvulin-like peptidyl-prolyl isomerase